MLDAFGMQSTGMNPILCENPAKRSHAHLWMTAGRLSPRSLGLKAGGRNVGLVQGQKGICHPAREIRSDTLLVRSRIWALHLCVPSSDRI